MTTVDEARAQGRIAGAQGLDYQACPYGHDQQELREAWCKAATEERNKTGPWMQRDGLLQTVLGWVIFLAAIALFFKIWEAFFGPPNGDRFNW